MAKVSRLSNVALKNDIFQQINNVALGNHKRGLKEVASDLLNQLGRDQIKNIALGTFLGASTIERVMDLKEAKSGAEYQPMASTLERIYRYCGAELQFHEVTIKPKFRNEPKD